MKKYLKNTEDMRVITCWSLRELNHADNLYWLYRIHVRSRNEYACQVWPHALLEPSCRKHPAMYLKLVAANKSYEDASLDHQLVTMQQHIAKNCAIN